MPRGAATIESNQPRGGEAEKGKGKKIRKRKEGSKNGSNPRHADTQPLVPNTGRSSTRHQARSVREGKEDKKTQKIRLGGKPVISARGTGRKTPAGHPSGVQQKRSPSKEKNSQRGGSHWPWRKK